MIDSIPTESQTFTKLKTKLIKNCMIFTKTMDTHDAQSKKKKLWPSVALRW